MFERKFYKDVEINAVDESVVLRLYDEERDRRDSAYISLDIHDTELLIEMLAKAGREAISTMSMIARAHKEES